VKPHIVAENLVMFEKQLSRHKKMKNKNTMSTPAYNPNFDLVQKKLTIGVPIFEKQTGRKFVGPPKNCLMEYDIEDVERGTAFMLGHKAQFPDFEKMHGRNTLNSRS